MVQKKIYHEKPRINQGEVFGVVFIAVYTLSVDKTAFPANSKTSTAKYCNTAAKYTLMSASD